LVPLAALPRTGRRKPRGRSTSVPPEAPHRKRRTAESWEIARNALAKNIIGLNKTDKTMHTTLAN